MGVLGEVEATDTSANEGAKHPAPLDIRPEDVRRVFPLAVAHRLRVRSGPGDEVLASMEFGAAGAQGEGAMWPGGRRTVREILKEILDTI